MARSSSSNPAGAATWTFGRCRWNERQENQERPHSCRKESGQPERTEPPAQALPEVSGAVAEAVQLAEMLVFEYSQQSVARGGQAIFSDINIYWETPKHFAAVPAIGPGGKETGRTYGDYQREAQRFAMALFDIYKEGDGTGRPFFFPKPLVHITDQDKGGMHRNRL